MSFVRGRRHDIVRQIWATLRVSDAALSNRTRFQTCCLVVSRDSALWVIVWPRIWHLSVVDEWKTHYATSLCFSPHRRTLSQTDSRTDRPRNVNIWYRNSVTVCMWICWTRPWTLQKRMNRPRCRLEARLCMGPRNHVLDGVYTLASPGEYDWTIRVRDDAALCQITSWTTFMQFRNRATTRSSAASDGPRDALSVNILSTVETSCTTNAQRLAVMELEGYSWSTCSKQPRLVDCRMGVVNKLDSTANDDDDDGLFTTPSTFRSKSPEFGTKR